MAEPYELRTTIDGYHITAKVLPEGKPPWEAFQHNQPHELIIVNGTVRHYSGTRPIDDAERRDLLAKLDSHMRGRHHMEREICDLLKNFVGRFPKEPV